MGPLQIFALLQQPLIVPENKNVMNVTRTCYILICDE